MHAQKSMVGVGPVFCDRGVRPMQFERTPALGKLLNSSIKKKYGKVGARGVSAFGPEKGQDKDLAYLDYPKF